MIGVVVRIVVISAVLVVIYLRLRAAKLAGKAVIEEYHRPPELPQTRHEWRPVAAGSISLDLVRAVVGTAAAAQVLGARETQIGATTITVFDLQHELPPAHPLACVRVTMPQVVYPHLVLGPDAPADDSEFAHELLDDKLRAFIQGESALRGLVIDGSEFVAVLESALALYDRATGRRATAESMTLYPPELLVPGDIEHRLAFVAGFLERIPAGSRDRYRTEDLSGSK